DSDPEIQIEMSDAFNLIYSSGTTGTPKGILHNHWMRSAQMDRVSPNGYDDNARTLLSTPLYSNTTIVSFLPTLYGCSTVYLMPKFDARGYLEIVQREKITHTMLVPVQYKRIMDVADFDAFDLSSMQVKFSTSAPLRAEVKADVLARFPGKLLEYYGLTEGGGVTVLNSAEHPDKLHTVGQPAPGNEIRLIDETGKEVPKGTVGEICGRGPTMMAGYFGRDDLTADYIWRDAAGNVFFRSGDMGRFDEDGFLILSDRKKDMIISGGLNIYADDLELVLLADPDVTDAAVIGVPSDAWGETPYGLVVLREGATRSGDDICADANAKLGKSQRLSAVELRDELPRSSIGKILKKELRAPFWAAVSA
ncbi:long-chain fatty acid--CoA ligase, partial [Rhodobacteraceae bacterium R_SAG8]|nr:long-chain fatty acid--CoA ligase [Rhodobacteraceae bacterium R_SAG8]